MLHHVDIKPQSFDFFAQSLPRGPPAKHPTSADLHHSAPLPAAHRTISVLAPGRWHMAPWQSQDFWGHQTVAGKSPGNHGALNMGKSMGKSVRSSWDTCRSPRFEEKRTHRPTGPATIELPMPLSIGLRNDLSPPDTGVFPTSYWCLALVFLNGTT